jgi:peptide/nickel transport system substrate-binding protein
MTAAFRVAAFAVLNGVGPHVEESGLGLIAGHAYSAPYEDIRIKK